MSDIIIGNKCIKIAGFYEYNIRNFYINYLKIFRYYQIDQVQTIHR